MSTNGDHDGAMSPFQQIDDDSIEALVRGERIRTRVAGDIGGPRSPMHGPIRAFVDQLQQVVADEPAPQPSAELVALLEGIATPLGSRPVATASRALRTPGRDLSERRPTRPLRRTRRVLGIAGSKVAMMGVAAKVSLGGALVGMGVVGAGAAGALPESANDAVRGAIESVSPVDFDDRANGGGSGRRGGNDEQPATSNFGDRVSPDATGESDGDNGVDGGTISEQAPGAEHRPDGAGSPRDRPSPNDSTGREPANETPADEHVPEDPGSSGAGGGSGDHPRPPVSPSSTTPDGPPATRP